MKKANIILFWTFIVSVSFLFLAAQENIPEIAPISIPYKITGTYPHHPDSFTQGFIFEGGFLYEGTGQYGSSYLRKIDLETGKIIKENRLPQNLFGEGITIFGDKIIQLTWLSQTGFVYDKDSFRLLKTFRYPLPIEGWGITTDGENLILSDGSNRLFFLDPVSFQVKKRLDVYDNRGPVRKINELEYVDGIMYANVWQSNSIIKIDMDSGKVIGKIDLGNIVPKLFRGHVDNVLNGIAYDNKRKRFLVTGKMWPLIFEMELLAQK